LVAPVPETPPLATLGWSYSGLQTAIPLVKDVCVVWEWL